MHLRFNNVLNRTSNLLRTQIPKNPKITNSTTSNIKNNLNVKLECLHFSTYPPYLQPLNQINKIIQKSTELNQSLNPSDLDFITPNIIDTCIRKADETLLQNRLQHFKNTATAKNKNSIISLNPLSKHHHKDPFSGYLIDVPTLDSLKEKLSKPLDSSSLNMSKRIKIIEKMLMLIPEHIKSLMTTIMLGGPKPAEGAKYEILEAKWLLERVLDGVKQIHESQDLKFSDQLSQQHSIVAVPSNFFALGLPDFVNLFFHGSDHIMVVTPPQSIPFWQKIESILIESELPKSNITITTVTSFPEDLIELTSMVNAARMVGSTQTYELMAKSIATNTNSASIYLGGEVSGDPNVNQGVEDAQHVFSVALGNLGNTGELCSSSSDVVTTDRDPVNPMFADDLQITIDNKTHSNLATTYKPNEELAKSLKPPSVTISDYPAKEIWGPHFAVSSSPVTKHINTNHALTHAITHDDAKNIVENLTLSLAGNKYVAYTSKGACLQPMGTNPLAVVPPTSFGSPTSYAVRGDQPGQNTLQSALQFAHLDPVTNMKQEALETILNHILTSASASKPYSGYPMFNTSTENLDNKKVTSMQTFTLFESKPILINISNTTQLKQLDSLLESLNESPFKHKIYINFNNIPQSNHYDIILDLPKHDENSYFCLENIDVAKFAEKFDRPSLILSFSELPKTIKQKLYKTGHSVSTSTDKLEIAMKLVTQSSLCIGVNPENRSLSNAEKKIAEPLLNIKLKSNRHSTFNHLDQPPIK